MFRQPAARAASFSQLCIDSGYSSLGLTLAVGTKDFLVSVLVSLTRRRLLKPRSRLTYETQTWSRLSVPFSKKFSSKNLGLVTHFSAFES